MKKLFALITVVTLVAMLFAGCGGEAKPTEAAEEILDLTSWELVPTTWSSPNGTTVTLSAVPAGYVEGQSAAFIIRLEGEEVKNVPCEYDGKVYTAAADLNGADGYCYYVLLTGSDGATAEIPVNIPTEPTDETLINMATSLQSSCSLVVSAYDYDGKWLAVTGGSIQVQPPRITNKGETVVCDKVELVLTLNEEEVERVAVEMSEADEDGSYTLALTDLTFEAPAMEDDQQLSVRLEVLLSNGQSMSASGGTWAYMDGKLLMGMG